MKDATSSKSKLASGALWTSVLTLISMPLAYLRNWFGAQIGDGVIGNYATMMILFNIVITFFLFGGITTYSTYLPKIKLKEDKFRFITTSATISLFILMVASTIILMCPEILQAILKVNLPYSDVILIVVMINSIGVGQIGLYSLAGLRKYSLSAPLANLQLFFIVILFSCGFFFFREVMLSRSFCIIAFLIITVWLTIACIGLKVTCRETAPAKGFFLPSGFWKQSIFVHLSTVLTFSYGYIDQILVLGKLGTNQLAKYFLTLQLAQLVSIITIKIGQVLLSSFSSYLKSDSVEAQRRLVNEYNSVAKLCLFISFSISTFLILFGFDVLKLFKSATPFNKIEFYLLVVAFFSSCLGSVNSMVIIAKEKNQWFFINNLVIVLLQVILAVILVDLYGVLGIIIARLFVCSIAQIFMAFIMYFHCNLQFYRPLRFFMLLITLCLLSILSQAELAVISRLVTYVSVIACAILFLDLDVKSYLTKLKGFKW